MTSSLIEGLIVSKQPLPKGKKDFICSRHREDSFQVLVGNDHQKLLHFLQWQDGDLWKEPVDPENFGFSKGNIIMLRNES